MDFVMKQGFLPQRTLPTLFRTADLTKCSFSWIHKVVLHFYLQIISVYTTFFVILKDWFILFVSCLLFCTNNFARMWCKVNQLEPNDFTHSASDFNIRLVFTWRNTTSPRSVVNYFQWSILSYLFFHVITFKQNGRKFRDNWISLIWVCALSYTSRTNPQDPNNRENKVAPLLEKQYYVGSSCPLGRWNRCPPIFGAF